MEWLAELKESDLPTQYREMSEIIGLENTIRLAEYFGKTGFYFVSLDGVISAKKREYISKNFNGSNHREMARATDYSLVWVYKIIEENRAISKIKQRMLFENPKS